jgi:hypothetical protein
MTAKAIDKSTWPAGPWHNEPDRVEFRAHGFACLLNRVAGHSGHWCGYVALPPGHPWRSVRDEQDIPAHVHGGITYAGPCHGEICHVPAPGEPDDVVWIGFDCCHCDDQSPLDQRLGATYRDVDYVRAQCESLALQAAEASK